MRTLPRPGFALNRTAASRHDDMRDDDRAAWRDWAAHVDAGRIGDGASTAAAAGNAAAIGWPPQRFTGD